MENRVLSQTRPYFVDRNMDPNPSATQVDNRMEYLGMFVQKTLKLKPEKWSRLMATEEHKAVVMKFLERPSPMLLVIILTPTAQLVASNTFPLVQLKNKGTFQYTAQETCKY